MLSICTCLDEAGRFAELPVCFFCCVIASERLRPKSAILTTPCDDRGRFQPHVGVIAANKIFWHRA